MVPVACSNPGNSGEDVDDGEPRRTIEFLHLRSDDPDRIGIEEYVQKANVDENRRQKPPVLALVDVDIGFHAEGEKCVFVCRATCKGHDPEDQNVDPEENVGDRRLARPEGLKKFDVAFFDHCEIENVWIISKRQSGCSSIFSLVICRTRYPSSSSLSVLFASYSTCPG